MSSPNFFLVSSRPLAILLLGALTISCLSCRSRGSKEASFPQLGSRIEVSPLIVTYAESVQPIAKDTRDAQGTAIEFNEFEVQALVYVQTCENILEKNSCFEAARAKFLIGLAEDPGGVYCRSFLQRIATYWESKDENYIRNYRLLPADKHFFRVGDDYILYERPRDNWSASYWLFYADNVLVRIELLDYDSPKGFGALDSFVTENIVFRLEGRDFRPAYRSMLSPEEFMKLYREGMLNCALNE